jgi:dihydrofolate reductase
MISLITAMDRNRVIGKDNQIPWHLPADLAYFKQLTLGHPVIMGRKTFESLGKPLPGRTNVILTENLSYHKAGCIIRHSIAEALEFYADQEAFVIGGATIYKAFLPIANRLLVTLIEESFFGDTLFPEIDEQIWQLVSKSQGERNEKNPYDYSFLVYEKR